MLAWDRHLEQAPGAESAGSLLSVPVESLVAFLVAFAPRVEVVRPGLCVLASRGPARYYGGEERLRVKVAEAVDEAVERVRALFTDERALLVASVGCLSREQAEGRCRS